MPTSTLPRPLDVIRIENPCPADWRAMRGDNRTRFCAHCSRHVHDLSAMTEDEATRLLCERAGALCVRFSKDATGKVRTLDYQEARTRRWGWRFWGLLGVGGAMASWGINLLTSSPRTTMGAPPPMMMTSATTSQSGQCVVPTTNPVGTEAPDAGD